MKTEKNKKLKAVIYCRSTTWSTKNITNQKSACLEFARDKNYEVVSQFIDNGKPGSHLNRPGIKKVLDFIKNSQVDYLITTRNDILSKNVSDFLALKALLVSFKTEPLYVFGPNATNTFLGSVLISVAQYESEMRSLMIKRGLWFKKHGK